MKRRLSSHQRVIFKILKIFKAVIMMMRWRRITPGRKCSTYPSFKKIDKLSIIPAHLLVQLAEASPLMSKKLSFKKKSENLFNKTHPNAKKERAVHYQKIKWIQNNQIFNNRESKLKNNALYNMLKSNIIVKKKQENLNQSNYFNKNLKIWCNKGKNNIKS